MKHKRGKLFGDLTNHGDEVVVARGGQGGVRYWLAANIFGC